MREWFLAKVHDWYILGVGLIIVGGGLIAASWYSPQLGPSNIAPSANGQPGTQATAATTISRPPNGQPAPQASSGDTQHLAPVPATHPANPAPHGHATAMPPAAVAQNVGQAPAANAPLSPALTGEAAAGRQVYKKCQACHSLEPGKNGVGPSLTGIIGKKAASVANYNYSPAMKASNITWDVASLNKYLLDPQKVIPGNKMPFPGLKTETERNALIAYLGGDASSSTPTAPTVAQAAPPAPAAQPQAAAPAPQAPNQPTASYDPGVRYTLRSGIAEGRMVFIGVGGTIDGQVNPVLSAAEGQVVQITLINGEGAEHDIVFPAQNAKSARITARGASTTLAFRAEKAGDFTYVCSVPGHELAGMQGQFLVTPKPPAQTVVEAVISREATDLPPPIGKRPPHTVRVDLISVELEGRLAEGATFGYWTFNGKVPGPFLRVRDGGPLAVNRLDAW